MSIFTLVLVLFFVSQGYWAWRGIRFVKKRVSSPAKQRLIIAVGFVAFVALAVYNFGFFSRRPSPVHLTLDRSDLRRTVHGLGGKFARWRRLSRSCSRFRRPSSESAVGSRGNAPNRAGKSLVRPSAACFWTGLRGLPPPHHCLPAPYGLLYGRLNLEQTTPVAKIPNLPKAFEGFRILQMSDIHIGPFMPQEQIRKFAEMANAIKPDLIVLTGDFVTFDANTPVRRRRRRAQRAAGALRESTGALATTIVGAALRIRSQRSSNSAASISYEPKPCRCH